MSAADHGADRIRHDFVELTEVRLHVAEAGPRDAEDVVILLHGFPECWISWRPVMARLSAAGVRAVAPDMRGYNLSDKPKGVSAYHVDRLCADVRELAALQGDARVHLVGHDWGAIVAWFAAMAFEDELASLTICNVPHPVHFEGMIRSPEQLRRSTYIAFFQLPLLPEHLIARNDWDLLRRTLRSGRVRGTLDDATLDEYVRAARRPDALRSMLNYYRALVRTGPFALRRRWRTLNLPVEVVWGERDAYLGKEFAEPPADWVPDARTHFLPEASHWVQMDAPDVVADVILSQRDAARDR